jgi:hypothetical protein
MMPICKLCKEERELQESHFLPAAVYAQLRGATQQNPNPVLISNRNSIATSRQITGRVLCGKCEQRFSKFGEAWVLGNMARADGFKIQDTVIASQPLGANETIAFYSSKSMPEIDMDALVYFSMSVFWRASAHIWRKISGPMEGIDLGPFEEPIRRFLLGDKFPADTVILVSVWPTKEVLPAAYTPRRGKSPDCHFFNFLIPGLEFKLFTGRRIPDSLRAMCSHASSEKFLYSAMSIVSDTIEAFEALMRTSRPSKSLSALVKSSTPS